MPSSGPFGACVLVASLFEAESADWRGAEQYVHRGGGNAISERWSPRDDPPVSGLAGEWLVEQEEYVDSTTLESVTWRRV